MHRQTHTVISAAAAATLVPGNGFIEVLTGAAAGGMAGTLPDLDITLRWLGVKHRGLSHSVFPAALFLVAGVGAWVGGAPSVLSAALTGAGIGYAFHIIADAMTISGVRPFEPLSDVCFKGPVSTKGNQVPFFLSFEKLQKRRHRKGKKPTSRRTEEWDWRESLIGLLALVMLFVSLLSRLR